MVTTRALPSHRRLDTVRAPCWAPTTSPPSDRSLYSYLNGLPPVRSSALWRNVGSRCSMFQTPLCTASAPGLSVLACRFRIHSPEKLGFSCPTPEPTTVRRIAVAIHVSIIIVHLMSNEPPSRLHEDNGGIVQPRRSYQSNTRSARNVIQRFGAPTVPANSS